MKKCLTLFACLCIYLFSSSQATVSFYSYSWPDFNGDTVSMSQYAGQKLMIVNVASQCVFTPNFAPLEQLDSLYSKYRFQVIGFPCNDFNHQEGSDSELIDTCKSYHVNFPLMGSVSIITGDTAPIYKWLQCKSLNGVSNAHVTWNFNMFLIDRQGNWTRYIDVLSGMSPLDTSITNWIIEDSASLTGINPLSDDAALRLKSPNPCSTSIDFAVNPASVQNLDINVYSIDGRLAGNIYHGGAAGEQFISYPVAGLASGIYVVRAQTPEGQQTFRVVVQH